MEQLTGSNFEEKTSTGKCAVLLWARWCGPCRVLLSVMEQFSKSGEYGAVEFSFVNVDPDHKDKKIKELISRFEVRAIPVLLFFKEGALLEKIIGAVSKVTIESAIERHLL